MAKKSKVFKTTINRGGGKKGKDREIQNHMFNKKRKMAWTNIKLEPRKKRKWYNSKKKEKEGRKFTLKRLKQLKGSGSRGPCSWLAFVWGKNKNSNRLEKEKKKKKKKKKKFNDRWFFTLGSEMSVIQRGSQRERGKKKYGLLLKRGKKRTEKGSLLTKCVTGKANTTLQNNFLGGTKRKLCIPA